jgi:hypothetical protein
VSNRCNASATPSACTCRIPCRAHLRVSSEKPVEGRGPEEGRCLSKAPQLFKLVMSAGSSTSISMRGLAERSGVIEPGGGEIMTRGPVHFDRRATTSASRAKSANETLGWDFSWRQASFVGMVCNLSSMSVEGVVISTTPSEPLCGASSLLQHSLSRPPGQSLQGVELPTMSPIATQNARPKESPEHAEQLSGSPEHLAAQELGGAATGKMRPDEARS